jgi:hypothetical protein
MVDDARRVRVVTHVTTTQIRHQGLVLELPIAWREPMGMKDFRGFYVQTFTRLALFCSLVCSCGTTWPQSAFAQGADAWLVEHLVASSDASGVVDAQGTAARIRQPEAITGNSKFIFVHDGSTGTLRQIDRATAQVTTVRTLPQVPNLRIESEGLWASEDYLYFGNQYRIFRVTIATKELVTFAGSDYGLRDGVGEQAQFIGPYGITGDSQFLYVLDSGTFSQASRFNPASPLTPSTIRRISIDTREVVTFPIPNLGASGIQPAPHSISGDSTALFLSYTRAPIVRYFLPEGRLDRLGALPSEIIGPEFLWFDGHGSVFFTSGYGFGDAALWKLSVGTGETRKLPFPTPLTSNAQDPRGVWGDGSTIYVSDARNGAVVGLDTVAVAVGGSVARASLVAGLPPDALRLSNSQGPFGSSSGSVSSTSAVFGAAESRELYFTARNAVFRFSLSTHTITQLAGHLTEEGSADGSGLDARFTRPGALWSDGRLLFVGENNIVRQIDLNANVVTHVASVRTPAAGSVRGLWRVGQTLYVSIGQWIDRIALGTREVSPFVQLSGALGSLWSDGRDLFVLENGASSALQRIALETGAISRLALIPKTSTIEGAIWGQSGWLFVAHGLVIRAVNLANGDIQLVAGDAEVPGDTDGPGSGARFPAAYSVWGDGRDVYVADGTVRRISVVAGTPFSVAASGFRSWFTNRQGPLTVSYARVVSPSSNVMPEGIAIFSFRQGGMLISETAVPATLPLQSGRIFVEIVGSTNTGIAFANPNDRATTVNFYFTGASGERLRDGSFTLPANGQFAAFMDQVPFLAPAGARTFSFSASSPVGAVALLGLINERSEFLMTTLPVVQTGSSPTAPFVLPHFAVGAGWSTRVLLVNPTEATITGELRVLAPEGIEQGRVSYRVGPGTAEAVAVPALKDGLFAGSIRIVSDPGTILPVASTVFSYAVGGVTVTQNGISQANTSHALNLFVESAGAFGSPGSRRTGIAVANAGPLPESVRLDLVVNGVAVAPVNVRVPGGGQIARFLHEIPGFENLPATFEGTLKISILHEVYNDYGNGGISVIGLRGAYNERGDFLVTSLPALDLETPVVNGERIFPHIVSGDGYTTQFILLSRPAAAGEILVMTQDGVLLH